jgi:tetratricopeptide (TPR) repeat protein
MNATGLRKPRLRVAAGGAVLLAVAALAFAVWWSRPQTQSDPISKAAAAYAAGDWADAVRQAHQALNVRKDDPTGLRLLARGSARLGRDAVALAIYERHADDKLLEAEDYLLLGVLNQRRKRPDAAAQSWAKAVASDSVVPEILDEIARLQIQARRWDDAARTLEKLGNSPGWEGRGAMMLGAVRVELNNPPEAAGLFRRALELDPTAIKRSHQPEKLRRMIARTFLQVKSPAEAERILRNSTGQEPDEETSWLLSRVYLQQGDKPRGLAMLKRAGSYRAGHALEVEPGTYVGEGRCEQCHPSIFRESLASRHTQTYYRGDQLAVLPLPDHPLIDPDDPGVTHTFRKQNGEIHEETRVGNYVFDAVIEYAFGTADRYVSTVGRNARGDYRVSRLSYYDTAEGKGWDRSVLDPTTPTRAHPGEFQGMPIGVRGGLAKCLYCHVTNPRTGHNALGREMADRAIGCERCHGPGGNHLLAVQAGFPDLAIVNPSRASPGLASKKLCLDCHVLSNEFDESDPENPGWVRSQGIGWMRSRCNTESGGAFGCVTCHDPHQRASAMSAAEYDLSCLSCHSGTKSDVARPAVVSRGRSVPRTDSRACPVNPSQGCTACHMPRVRLDALHMKLTDHNIRVVAKKK